MREYLSTGWRALMLAILLVASSWIIGTYFQKIETMAEEDQADMARIPYRVVNGTAVFDMD